MRQLTSKEQTKLEEAMQATHENPTPPTRVNIIFHGLLAIQDVDTNYYDVLIPKTTSNHHEALYGNPCVENPYADPCLVDPNFAPLHSFGVPGKYGPGPVNFAIEGITPEPNHRRSFPSATNILVIKNSKVTAQLQNALVVIRVPKPLIIRHYRGGETHLDPLAENADTQAVLQRSPDVIHEVTVFSYTSFYKPRLVGPDCSWPIPQPNPCLPMLNMGIYSQPTMCCEDTDSQDFSALFKINPNVDFKVTLNKHPRVDDGPPLWTSPLQVGISFAELLALSELRQWKYQLICALLRCPLKVKPIHVEGEPLDIETALRSFSDVNSLSAIPGGCGSGVACDDGQ